ncbi:MAG TPA: pyridoxal-phosphate dependent enzyme [Anaerolineales bacterium]|nr:pyridoxal-phosphate dependent enzyme [Anaerolineales bacterium]HRF48038.1 pyridoxal-phosphate dependent enzyme [Anaerolineales bacterium]
MPEYINAVCQDCGHRRPFVLQEITCPRCGGEFAEAEYGLDAREGLLAEWRNRDIGLRRFGALLPLRDPDHMVTLGEGDTPLIPLNHLGQLLGHPRLFAKDERQSPTASFKDRQAALAVSAMKEAGLTEAVVSSTGNVAIAYAAYCARAGIRLTAFLTPTVPAEKMRECALYGAHIIKATTTYDASKKLAARFAEERGLYYDRGLRSIPSLESMKTIVFEVAEQLAALDRRSDAPRYVAPDWYVQSISGGLGPVGAGKAFRELFDLGLTDRLPKLAGVQVDGCAPMVTSFARGLSVAEPVHEPRTRVSTLATGEPGRAYQRIKNYIDTHGGSLIAVSDEDGFRAMHQLAKLEGLSMEPGAAVAFAGVIKLIRNGVIKPDETVVINCTGHTFPVEPEVLGQQWWRDWETIDTPAQTGSLAAAPETEGMPAALSRIDVRVRSIAILEDNADSARLLRRVLQAHSDYVIHEATDGIAGLELIRQRQPDLVILDLMMPGLDGFGVLDALRADEALRGIPVIVVTARSLSSEERQRLASQAGAVWHKGEFLDDDLLVEVERVLR